MTEALAREIQSIHKADTNANRHKPMCTGLKKKKKKGRERERKRERGTGLQGTGYRGSPPDECELRMMRRNNRGSGAAGRMMMTANTVGKTHAV